MIARRAGENRFGNSALTMTPELRDEINKYIRENGGKKALIPKSEIDATLIQGAKHDAQLTILLKPPASVSPGKAAHRHYYRFLDARGYYFLSQGCKLKDGNKEENIRAIEGGASIQEDPNCFTEVEKETRHHKDRKQDPLFPDFEYGYRVFFGLQEDKRPKEKLMVLFAALFKDEIRDKKFLKDHHDDILALRKRLFPLDAKENPEAMEKDLLPK